jgi:integrase
MPTIKAFIRTAKKDGDVNVRFRYSDGRDVQLFHKSEILVKPDTLDPKKDCIKAKINFDATKRKKIDTAITDRKNLISDICITADKDTLTSEFLNTEIDKKLHPDKYEIKPEISTLFQFVDYFVEHAKERKDKGTGRLLSKRTTQHYSSTQKHLKGFAQKVRKSDFEFKELNQNFYDGFIDYLQGLNFTQNNVGRHIKTLKMILNEATLKGFDTGTYWKSYRAFSEDIDNVYLTEDELQQLKDADIKQDYLSHVRDWFLLLAWTGSRFSDLSKITETDIKDGFITFRQQKTNNKVTIPLHPVVLEIFKKYNYQMPKQITNQRFNEYIKEACKVAKIKDKETTTKTIGGKLVTKTLEKWELISSHTGRRSFCTNMYKRGLPTLMIMSISGHTTEKSFLKYIKITQSEHAEMMKKAWANMYNNK